MVITVFVKARAREDSIEWMDEDTAKISVTAVPVKGKANAAVIKVLAKNLGIAPSRILLTSGVTAKMKQFTIQKTTD